MENAELPGLVLMLALGLRHGLDPDHIALIDGLAMRSQKKDGGFAPWIGTFFALGHGLTVTIIALVIHFASGLFTPPKFLLYFLEWLSVTLLLMVAILNLTSLIVHQDGFRPIGWRSRFVPSSIRERVRPLSILLTGIIFALVFDTATQAAAWGYAASGQGGWPRALVTGLVFTLGMVFTDTLDGFMLNKIWRHEKDRRALLKSRRVLGWLIVWMGFIVAGYQIVSVFVPSASLSDLVISICGGLFFLVLLLFYTYTWLILKSSKKNRYGH